MTKIMCQNIDCVHAVVNSNKPWAICKAKEVLIHNGWVCGTWQPTGLEQSNDSAGAMSRYVYHCGTCGYKTSSPSDFWWHINKHDNIPK